MSPVVVLEPVAREQAPVLANLFELYAHDFSEYLTIGVKESGRFEVPIGDVWWSSDGHHPFFVRRAGALAGFALARRGSRVTGAGDVMDVAEFFVIRGVRRQGVGISAAHALFRAFPGPWEVRVRRANAPAAAFWSRAIGGWTGRPAESVGFTSGGVDWEVFRTGPSSA